MKKITPLTHLILLFSILVLPNCSKDHVSKGRDFLKVKMYQEALKEFQLEIQEHPTNADAWFYKGVAEVKIAVGEEELTPETFKKLLSKNTKIYDSFENALNSKPKFNTGEYAYLLGKVFQDKGKLQKAALEFEKYGKCKGAIPSYREEANYLLADCQFKLKDFKEAKKGFSSYLKDYESGRYNGKALIGYGESCLQLNEYDDAIDTFLKLSAEEGPLYKIAKYNLGQCYERKNQKEKAVHEYTSLALIDDLEKTKDESPYKAYERLLSLNESIPLKGVSHYPGLFKDKEIRVKGKIRPINKEDFGDAAWDLILKYANPESYRYIFSDNSYTEGMVLATKDKQALTGDQNISLQVKAIVYLNNFVYLEDTKLTSGVL